MSNKYVIFLFNIFQLLTLFLCIYIYTSTMPIVPWYEPLTMGAYFMTFFTMFLQGVVVVFYDLAYIAAILESILFVVFIYLGVVNLKKVV